MPKKRHPLEKFLDFTEELRTSDTRSETQKAEAEAQKCSKCGKKPAKYPSGNCEDCEENY